MLLLWIILISSSTLVTCEEQLKLMAKSLSSRLYKYTGYVDGVILHYKVPQDTSFASFKFQAEEVPLSIFGCKPRSISFYIKQGSPPVVNPDGSKFPNIFVNVSRPILHIWEFKSDKQFNYINISSPFAGSYFGLAFISYVDPRTEGITQEGLTPNCLTLLNTALYVKRVTDVNIVVFESDTRVAFYPNRHEMFKFHVPELADFMVLEINEMHFCENCTDLLIKIRSNRIPESNKALYDIKLSQEKYDNRTFSLRFMAIENHWYYVDFVFIYPDNNDTTTYEDSEIVFKIKPFSTDLNISYANDVHYQTAVKTHTLTGNEVTMIVPNSSVLFKHSILRYYHSNYLNYSISTNQYNLVREGHVESFMYLFDIAPFPNGSTPLAIDITDTSVVMLKFFLNEGIDVGGTLQFSIAFKPRIKIVDNVRIIEDEPANHTIVACIRNNAKEIPTWPNKCIYNRQINVAPIILNKTIDNFTIGMPYPEPGYWYASLKLFCGEPKPCDCGKTCKSDFQHCLKSCEANCSSKICDFCLETCENKITRQPECKGCDCEGRYQRSPGRCNSSFIFTLASYPCVSGKCGPNGKCMYMVSQGLSYSVCICSHKYRGWDCSDDTFATSFTMIMIELLLLVLSNLMFLPAVYFAYKRRYYSEAIVYFSTCFFSTFYHACDAGENIYSFCLVKLSVLQFSDFFSGLLSIWVTLIAMAHLPEPLPSLCQITGAILLAFGTTVDKASLWVFAVPFTTGIVILVISWFLHYRKTRVRFPSNRYMCCIFPIGVLVVGIALIVYALLQTQSNYKYLHSMWHIMMAVAIMILLPDRKTFLPPSTVINGLDSS